MKYKIKKKKWLKIFVWRKLSANLLAAVFYIDIESLYLIYLFLNL